MIRVITIGFILFLNSCSNIEDTLTLKKKPSGDEFLIEKKNPLVVPPSFGDLPKPIGSSNKSFENSEKKDNKDELKKILKLDEENSQEINTSRSSSLEKSILEKIK